MADDYSAVVLGNVAFDIICYPVDDVPRSSSITFDNAVISPGGCGSNSAIGLSVLGIQTSLISCIGDDLPGSLAIAYWDEFGVNTQFIHKLPDAKTGVSIGLVDHDGEPRFVHTTGANQFIDVGLIPMEKISSGNLRAFHVAGYFLMPGLLVPDFAQVLEKLHNAGVLITIDVAETPRMSHPEVLWRNLPFVDIFLCNAQEAARMTNKNDPKDAARVLLDHGAGQIIVKLGKQGCLFVNSTVQQVIPAPAVEVLDSTGAGDAFAAGLIHSIIQGADFVEACQFANQVGAKMVTTLGAVEAWRK